MRWFFVVLFVLFVACGSDGDDAPAPLREFTYEIFKAGSSLGTLHVRPGQFGDFTPSSAAEAEAFRKRWEEEKAKGSFAFKMHRPSKNGERGALSRFTYKPDTPGYEDGLQIFLHNEGYAYKEVSPIQQR